MQLNPHYAELNESYLFRYHRPQGGRLPEGHPEADIIRLGIGDVTLPLAASVTEAMHKAVEEQGGAPSTATFPASRGYEFLREAIRKVLRRPRRRGWICRKFSFPTVPRDLGNLLDLFSQDNTILVPDPVYPVYVDDNVMAGRKKSCICPPPQRMASCPCRRRPPTRTSSTSVAPTTRPATLLWSS